jgi:adenylate kinase
LDGFLGLTGTPGTGKKSIAPLLAARLKIPSVSLNEYASELGLGERKNGALLVDTEELRTSILKHQPRPSLVYGHLLPEVLRADEVERVFVLRCDPRVLKRRLFSRGYNEAKVRQNLEAELIGVVMYACISAYSDESVFGFDTTRTSAEQAARTLARRFIRPNLHESEIDWVPSYASAAKLRSLFSLESAGSALI